MLCWHYGSPKLGREMLNKVVQTLKGISKGSAWLKRFNPTAPKTGDAAIDFELSDVRGENPIRLSQFFGQRSVALVFGSFT